MLMRDLQAAVVLQDTVAWIHDQSAALPSALEVDAGDSRPGTLCDGL